VAITPLSFRVVIVVPPQPGSPSRLALGACNHAQDSQGAAPAT
jgi:hypothetical protein